MWILQKNNTKLLLLSVCLCNIIQGGQLISTKSKRKICIVGAGPTGLAAARHASKYPNEFDIVAFERNADIGGQWYYSDDPFFDEYGLPVHSSIYKNLITNAPLQLIMYTDYRNSTYDLRRVVHHTVYHNYLKNYTDFYNLRQYIQLSTLVTKVSPVDDKSFNTKWSIKTRNLKSNTDSETICDVVMVCNGHLARPKIPKVPGIENFPGVVIHSHNYRHPEDFANKTVVVLGAGPSGVDVGLEIAKYAKLVYLSHNHPKLIGDFPPNLIQVSGVKSANGSRLILRDGTFVDGANAMVYCTGYLYDASFISESVTLERDNPNKIGPLYRETISAKYPTLAFIALREANNYLSLVYPQIQYFMSVLRGKVKLPDRRLMLNDNLIRKRDDSWSLEKQFLLEDTLVREGKFRGPDPWIRKACYVWHDHVSSNWVHFKKDMLEVEPPFKVRVIKVEH